MSDQCRHCQSRGDLTKCHETECFKCDDWYSEHLEDEIKQKDEKIQEWKRVATEQAQLHADDCYEKDERINQLEAENARLRGSGVMNKHAEIMNIQVNKRSQNKAIDEALKTFKTYHDILIAVYNRGHRDARHEAAKIAIMEDSDEQV